MMDGCWRNKIFGALPLSTLPETANDGNPINKEEI